MKEVGLNKIIFKDVYLKLLCFKEYILRKLPICWFQYGHVCIKAIKILRMNNNIKEPISLLLTFVLSFLNLNYLSYRQCLRACGLFTALDTMPISCQPLVLKKKIYFEVQLQVSLNLLGLNSLGILLAFLSGTFEL